MASEKRDHRSGHRQRLARELDKDPHGAVDYKLLEYVLSYVQVRKDAKPLAKELLEKFGSLGGILDAHPSQLEAIDGFGPSMALFLKILRELIFRYTEESATRKPSVTLDEIGRLCRARLASAEREEVWAALLDNGNRLLQFVQVTTGSVNHVLITPRDAVALTLKYQATGLVLVHNHPGGIPKPSAQDLETTALVAKAMKAVGLRLLDHLIIADGKYYSLLKNSGTPRPC